MEVGDILEKFFDAVKANKVANVKMILEEDKSLA